ncbi:type II secretion system protein [Aneurinibacillus sp. BA2021]|nr:type II secretion system protein [Aneurinibacillus sp. BA2021]
MKEAGFTYVEALLSLALFAGIVLATQGVLQLAIKEQAERKSEMAGYLLARSLLEQWKAGQAADTADREEDGIRYRIRMACGQSTERVETCEVEVRWQNKRGEARDITFRGYRLAPVPLIETKGE